MRNETLQSFERLLDIMDELREKCPWDRRQTIETLRMQTIEESYELCDAILDADWQAIRKELGDLLLHIVFYAKIGQEQRQFGMREVIDGICEKLVYRHPHIFGDGQAETADAVWYRDGDAGICEMRNGASFTCGDLNEFNELCEMFSGEDMTE